MQEVKADVAGQELVFGPFLDKTDGVSPETAISAPTAARIWKEGVTSTINLSTGRTPAWTHDGDGFYTVGSLASDFDTEGRCRIEITDAATHLPVWEDFKVMPTNPYDALVKGTDYLDISLVQWLGVAPLALVSQLVQAQANQLGAQGKLDVNAEVDTALDTAVPGTPTANSINERVKAIDDKLPTGTISDFDEASNPVEILASGGTAGKNAAELVDDVWDEDIVAAHGTASTAGLLLRVLGAAIATRTNNATLNALLGVPDVAANTIAETIWDEQPGTVSLAFRLIVERIYRFTQNKMNITDATGAVALRNEGDTADIMTQTITDDDTTTVRTASSWA